MRKCKKGPYLKQNSYYNKLLYILSKIFIIVIYVIIIIDILITTILFYTFSSSDDLSRTGNFRVYKTGIFPIRKNMCVKCVPLI